MGDPAGIGSEVVVKALTQKSVYEKCIPVVIGDYEALWDAIRFSGLNLSLNEVQAPEEAVGKLGVVDYINLNYLKPNSWNYKENSVLCGEASFQYVIYAIQLAKEGKVAAVITAPISKESINMAGHHYSGHTEIFAEYTGTKDFAMLLASDNLRVIHVTTHCALIEACRLIRKERVLKVIELANKACKMLGIENPKIGVAGLNPHCSENGLFGTEEASEIIPAVQMAQSQGIDVKGPESPDTVFVKCKAGIFDIVVAMYHDQGHIPLKLNGFQWNAAENKYSSVKGINTTIGLPIIRVSVDHGTAFGKAGEGRASADSLVEAIEVGLTMAGNSDLKVTPEKYYEKHEGV
ncbi:MAG: 4-hydroxythreonine-4-phosphate dehydrogenase PdxA [Lachnospiraceae bacterium]|nr:4-hydroxythreonine-4-phosphate dehydrogenase PdxA [Lachnospiraceae bacterium]